MDLPVVARAMHGRVGSTIVQIKFLLPGRNVHGAVHVVLSAAAISGRVPAQLRQFGGSVALPAPFRVRNHQHFVRVNVPANPFILVFKCSLFITIFPQLRLHACIHSFIRSFVRSSTRLFCSFSSLEAIRLILLAFRPGSR